MKVAIVNTHDYDGGAAKAAFRLHQALNLNGINSKMIVLEKKTNYKNVIKVHYTKFNEILALTLKKIPNKILFETIYKNCNSFSTGKIGLDISNNQIIKKADIIHLHWINGNFIDISKLQYINKPIIWTLHDMWPFTGGCHYTGNCEKYKLECNKCPVLTSNLSYDLSTNVFRYKKKYYNKNLTIITPSKWLGQCAKESNLFNNNTIVNISNTLNTNIFKPYTKTEVRKKFNIENDKFVILFGAVSATKDKRKGFEYLKKALKLIVQNSIINNIEIVIFGSNDLKEIKTSKANLRYLGEIYNDQELAQIYSMSNVFVIPSLEDNLPNTILESLACSTPVVGFNVGGIPDLIDHKTNGYLAKYKDAEDLANGIQWIYINNKDNWLGKNARNKVNKNNSNGVIARQYINLYKSLLK